MRTSMCLLGDPGPKSIVPDAHRAGLVTGVGHDMLRVGPVKIFTEARFHYMFITHGRGASFIPVTVGVRF